MSHICSLCHHANRIEARFCARCGEPRLSVAPPPIPPEADLPGPRTARRTVPKPPVVVPHRKARRRMAGFVPVVLLLGLGFGFVSFFGDLTRNDWTRFTQPRSRLVVHDLGDSARRAVFDLLKPDDVSVLISESRGALAVAGTRDEVAAVEGIVALIRQTKPSTKSRHRPGTIRRRYKLNRNHAAALARVLSFTDWSIRLHHEGKNLTVTAGTTDHRRIEAIVRMLGGRRTD